MKYSVWNVEVEANRDAVNASAGAVLSDIAEIQFSAIIPKFAESLFSYKMDSTPFGATSRITIKKCILKL